MRAVKRVLVLSHAWLRSVLGQGCTSVESREDFVRCVSLFRGSREYVVLGRFLAGNSENRIVYLGDDGVLSRVFGDRVLDLYGSRTRLRCMECGHRWWIDEGGSRCPFCGSENYDPDYTPPGERPRQRRLLEALYEVTSADEVFFSELDEPVELIGLLLLLVTMKFAKRVAMLGRKPSILPREIPVIESLEEVLG